MPTTSTTAHEGTNGEACEQVAEVVALFLRFFFAALLIFGFLFANVLLGRCQRLLSEVRGLVCRCDNGGQGGLSEAVVIPSFTPRTVNSIANSLDAAMVGSAIIDSAAVAKSLREYTTAPPRTRGFYRT